MHIVLSIRLGIPPEEVSKAAVLALNSHRKHRRTGHSAQQREDTHHLQDEYECEGGPLKLVGQFSSRKVLRDWSVQSEDHCGHEHAAAPRDT